MEAKRSTKSSRGLDCKQITPFLRFFFFLPRSVSGENVDDPLAAAGLVPACRARVLGGRFCGGAGEIPSGEVVMLSITNAFDDRFLNFELLFAHFLSLSKRTPARALQVCREDSRLLVRGSQGAGEEGKTE